MLIKMGYNVIVPHLSYYMWLHPSGDISYDRWLQMDKEIIKKCDAVVVLSRSPGVLQEIECCEENNIPVYDILEIDKLPKP